MTVRLRYRADEADRRYGRFTSQVFPDLTSAVDWARSNVAPADQLGFDEVTSGVPAGGASTVDVALRIAAGPNIPGDAFTYVPDDWGGRWRPARLEARSRQVLVHAWGDSITDGGGATSGELVDRGWFGLVTNFLRAAYGDGGSGYLGHGTARTTTGTWAGGQGFSGANGTATAAASKSWTGLRGTTVRLFVRNLGSGAAGTLRYRIDGETFINVTPPVGFSVEPGVVVRSGLPDVPHTVDVEWVSGTVTLHGVQATYPTGIVAARCSQGGKAASDYSLNEIERITIGITNNSNAITAAVPGVFTSSMIGRFISGNNIPNGASITGAPSVTSAAMSVNAAATNSATIATISYASSENVGVPGITVDPFLSTGLGRADVVILCLGVNDGADLARNANSVRNGLAHIVKAYTAGSSLAYTPDFVIMIEHQGDWFDTDGEWPEYTTEIAAYANSIGAALIDIWGMGRRSHQYWQDLGLFADSIHPNDAGHVAYARPVIDLLTS